MLFSAAQAIFYTVSSAAFHVGLRNLKYHNEIEDEQQAKPINKPWNWLCALKDQKVEYNLQ